MKNKALLFVIAVLLSSRLLLMLLGVVMQNGLTFESWVHWDGGWYMDIIENGYNSGYAEFPPEHAACNQGAGTCQRNFAFFPAYPVLVKGVSTVTGIGPEWSGIITSNLFFIGAGVLLFFLTKKLFSEKIAVIATMFLAFFPFSYIFSGFMTESMFLFFLLLTFFLAVKQHYFWAGISGIVLAATRNTGVLVVLPLFLLTLEQNRLDSLKSIFNYFKKNPLRLFLIALPVLGLVAFMLYLNNQVGDPFAFVNIQKYWEKPVLGLNPLFGIVFSLFDTRLEGSLRQHLWDLGALFVFILLFVYSLRDKKFNWSLKNIFIWLLVPMSAGSLLALPRYGAVIFPAYIALALILSRWPKLLLPAIILCAVLQLVLGYFYIKGLWLTV